MTKEQPAHSKLGASSAYRWMNCPGSVRLCEKVPNTTSSYAEEGTKAHELAEVILGSHFDNVTTSLRVPLGSEMLNAVTEYTDYVLNKHQKLGFTQMYIEKQVTLKFMDESMFGTADCILYNELTNELEIVDYKHGAGVPVEADCIQLKYYALGALHSKHLDYQEKKTLSIIATIVQPRAEHSEGAVRSHRYTYEDLRSFEAELKVAVENTQKANAPLKVGDHCRWCNAKAICPKMEQEVQETAMAVFKEDRVELPEPITLNIAQIKRALDFASIAQTWFKAVESYAQNTAELGEKIPGYKLVAKRSNRKWIDEDDAAKYMIGEKVDPYHKKIMSPAQAEKLCGKTSIENMCIKPEAGVTLVSESDKRSEVQPTIEVFKNDQ